MDEDKKIIENYRKNVSRDLWSIAWAIGVIVVALVDFLFRPH